MDFPKKQAQRLMPLYLLEYSEKLFENHPDPEAPWGGGGDYTAGYGIDITNDEISVDTTVIATKSDIASMVTTSMLEDALDDYALKTDIPENVSDLNNDAGYATETWVQNQGYSTFSGSYNDLTNKPDFSNYYYLNNNIEFGGYRTSVNEKGLEYSKEWNDNKISIISDYSGSEQWLSGKAVIVIENTNSKTAISDSIGVFDSSYNQGVIVGNDKVEVTNNRDSTSTSLESGKLTYIQYGNFNFNFNLPTSKNPGSYTLATTDDIPSLSGYATEYWVNNQGYITGITSSDVVAALGYTPGTSNFSGYYDDLFNKPTIPTATSQLTNDSGFITGVTWNDVTNKPTFATVATSGSYNDLSNKPTIPTVTNDLISVDLGIIGTSGTLSNDLYNALTANPEKTIAYTNSYAGSNKVQLFYKSGTASDLYYSGMSVMSASPGEPYKWTHYVLRIGLATSELGEKHYTLDNVDTGVALKQNLATVATSGSYNDLTNKPDLSIYAQSANLATVATSGSYNDLTNKPTIPDAVSGTNDGTNWTTLTIGNSTYDIPQGGSTPGMIGEVLYDVPNGQAGVNPITMAHSFADYSYVDIQYRCYDNAYEVKCVRVYDPNGKHVYLDWDVLVSGTVYAKKSIYELSGTTMTVRSGSDMQVWYSNGSTVGTQTTAAADYQHQIKITKVIGYKANSSALTTETWTFTLQDGTTITKNIVTA